MPDASLRWPCLDAATRHDAAARVPFEIDTPRGPVRVGSVAKAHLPLLAPFTDDLLPLAHGLRLVTAPADRTARLARIHDILRADGLLSGWRDEPYGIVEAAGMPALAVIERAASRFWGTLTFGAHCNGYVRDDQGRPTHLWIARRALTKGTDPGKLDNLVGGGVPWPETPAQALVREAWEEAGLSAPQIAQAQPQGVYRLHCDMAEGLQHEHLHVFDLALDDGVEPQNQDGEVAAFQRLPVRDALAHAAAGDMTVDAALATLDFGLRRGLLEAPARQALAAAAAQLRVSVPV